MTGYIDRDAFLSHERAWYCDNCDRRKNSKGKTVYEIGDAPCRACDIGDVLDLLEDYPASDVVERKAGVWIGEGDGYADGNMVYDMWYCGSCGCRFDEWDEKPDWKYCPVCGSYNGDDDDV